MLGWPTEGASSLNASLGITIPKKYMLFNSLEEREWHTDSLGKPIALCVPESQEKRLAAFKYR
jgi:hypothetical protein